MLIQITHANITYFMTVFLFQHFFTLSKHPIWKPLQSSFRIYQ